MSERTPEKRAHQLDVSFWLGRVLQVAQGVESLKNAPVLPDGVRADLRAAWYAINRAQNALEKERRP